MVKLISIFLLIPFLSYGQVIHHNTTGNIVSFDTVNTTTSFHQLEIPFTTYCNPHFDSLGSIALVGSFLLYKSARVAGWDTIHTNGGISQTALNDTAAAIRSIGYQFISNLVTTFSGADNNHYPSSLSTLNLVNTTFGLSVPISNYANDTVNWDMAWKKYLVSGSFNTGNGNITFTANDATTWIVNLDGRYLTSVGNGYGIIGGNTPTLDSSTIFSYLRSHLGIITGGIWNGTAIADAYVSSSTNWNTAYSSRIQSFTTTGSSGSATWGGGTLNVPTYTASGLGAVPLTRTLTINSVAQDLSGNQSWSVGTITSISAGDLSPLFTTSVANSTTTPAISYSLTAVASYNILGNNTGSSAAPTYFAPSLTGSLFANEGTITQILHGNASGTLSWAGVSLTTDVTGTLPIASGGTNATTTTSLNALPITYGANTNLHTPKCLTVCTTPSSTVAGSTAETNLLVFSIAAGTLPFPGFLLVTAHYRFAGTAGTKIMPIRFGNNSGSTTDYNLGSTGAIVSTQVQGFSECKMWLLTATSQDAFLTAGAATGSVNPVTFGSANTNNICYISFNKTMSSVADSAQLMEFTVWVYSN